MNKPHLDLNLYSQFYKVSVIDSSTKETSVSRLMCYYKLLNKEWTDNSASSRLSVASDFIEVLEGINNRSKALILAQAGRNKKVFGYAVVSHQKGAKDTLLDDIVATPNNVRLGTCLLLEAARVASTKSTRLSLFVQDDNEAAKKMYRACGMKQTRKLPYYYGPGLDDTAYQYEALCSVVIQKSFARLKQTLATFNHTCQYQVKPQKEKRLV